MVFPGNIIQALIIHIKLKTPFFFTNKTGAPSKELLVRINPLSNNSFKVFRNTNNLSRVILYKGPHGRFFFYPFLPFANVNV